MFSGVAGMVPIIRIIACYYAIILVNAYGTSIYIIHSKSRALAKFIRLGISWIWFEPYRKDVSP